MTDLETKFKRAVKRLRDGKISAIELWRDGDFSAKLYEAKPIDEDHLEWRNDYLLMYMKDSCEPYASFDSIREEK